MPGHDWSFAGVCHFEISHEAPDDVTRRRRVDRRRRRGVMGKGAATMASPTTDARPAQDARVRRELRSKIRTKLEDVKRNAEEMKKPENDELDRAVTYADELEENVERPREMLIGMELYGALGELALERTKRLGPRGSAEVSVHAFLQCLCRKYVSTQVDDQVLEAAENPGAFMWTALGTATSKFFSAAPTTGFMNGVMDTEIKERRVAQRRVKEAVGQAVAPDQVVDTNAERQTDQAMKAMRHKLRKEPGASTDIVRAVNNPSDFAQFVENVFTASFLVKDGNATITPAGAGKVPVFSDTPQPASGVNDRASFVLHMDMTNWQAMNALLGGDEGMMPTREEVDEAVLYGARGVVKNDYMKNESASHVADRKRGKEVTHGLHDSTNSKRSRTSESH